MRLLTTPHSSPADVHSLFSRIHKSEQNPFSPFISYRLLVQCLRQHLGVCDNIQTGGRMSWKTLVLTLDPVTLRRELSAIEVVLLGSQAFDVDSLIVLSVYSWLELSIRLPITVQGASRRVLSLSASDMKATSSREGDREPLPDQFSPVAGGIVALGKFDALHIGHRELAIQAAKAGTPFLLSFAGMAEVLGWEPRAPVVAKCDRQRVLSSWAASCGEVTPSEFEIEFSKVRNLSPRQFVEKLSKELGVRGVVAGKNYRFGYKAAGDASELRRLCEEYGIEAYIINPVMDKNQSKLDPGFTDAKEIGQVSSTRVRYALSEGNMRYVSELLGRQHRLILMTNAQEKFIGDKSRISSPRSCLLNLPPKEGLYENCHLIFGKENTVPCRVFIDTTDIHVELEVDTSINIPFGGRYLSIEFNA